MGRKGTTPIGREFLPNLSMPRLERAYREEGDGKAKLRLLAAMLRRRGKKMREISEELHAPPGTVHAWLQRFLKGGLKDVRDRHRSGRPSKLGLVELKQLRHDLVREPRANGFDAPFWTTKMVMEHVGKKYGKAYSARGMRDLLHRVGFSSRKPRPANAKRARREEVELFKKSAQPRQRIRKERLQGLRSGRDDLQPDAHCAERMVSEG